MTVIKDRIIDGVSIKFTMTATPGNFPSQKEEAKIAQEEALSKSGSHKEKVKRYKRDKLRI